MAIHDTSKLVGAFLDKYFEASRQIDKAAETVENSANKANKTMNKAANQTTQSMRKFAGILNKYGNDINKAIQAIGMNFSELESDTKTISKQFGENHDFTKASKQIDKDMVTFVRSLNKHVKEIQNTKDRINSTIKKDNLNSDDLKVLIRGFTPDEAEINQYTNKTISELKNQNVKITKVLQNQLKDRSKAVLAYRKKAVTINYDIKDASSNENSLKSMENFYKLGVYIDKIENEIVSVLSKANKNFEIPFDFTFTPESLQGLKSKIVKYANDVTSDNSIKKSFAKQINTLANLRTELNQNIGSNNNSGVKELLQNFEKSEKAVDNVGKAIQDATKDAEEFDKALKNAEQTIKRLNSGESTSAKGASKAKLIMKLAYDERNGINHDGTKAMKYAKTLMDQETDLQELYNNILSGKSIPVPSQVNNPVVIEKEELDALKEKAELVEKNADAQEKLNKAKSEDPKITPSTTSSTENNHQKIIDVITEEINKYKELTTQIREMNEQANNLSDAYTYYGRPGFGDHNEVSEIISNKFNKFIVDSQQGMIKKGHNEFQTKEFRQYINEMLKDIGSSDELVKAHLYSFMSQLDEYYDQLTDAQRKKINTFIQQQEPLYNEFMKTGGLESYATEDIEWLIDEKTANQVKASAEIIHNALLTMIPEGYGSHEESNLKNIIEIIRSGENIGSIIDEKNINVIDTITGEVKSLSVALKEVDFMRAWKEVFKFDIDDEQASKILYDKYNEIFKKVIDGAMSAKDAVAELKAEYDKLFGSSSTPSLSLTEESKQIKEEIVQLENEIKSDAGTELIQSILFGEDGHIKMPSTILKEIDDIQKEIDARLSKNINANISDLVNSKSKLIVTSVLNNLLSFDDVSKYISHKDIIYDEASRLGLGGFSSNFEYIDDTTNALSDLIEKAKELNKLQINPLDTSSTTPALSLTDSTLGNTDNAQKRQQELQEEVNNTISSYKELKKLLTWKTNPLSVKESPLNLPELANILRSNTNEDTILSILSNDADILKNKINALKPDIEVLKQFSSISDISSTDDIPKKMLEIEERLKEIKPLIDSNKQATTEYYGIQMKLWKLLDKYAGDYGYSARTYDKETYYNQADWIKSLLKSMIRNNNNMISYQDAENEVFKVFDNVWDAIYERNDIINTKWNSKLKENVQNPGDFMSFEKISAILNKWNGNDGFWARENFEKDKNELKEILALIKLIKENQKSIYQTDSSFEEKKRKYRIANKEWLEKHPKNVGQQQTAQATAPSAPPASPVPPGDDLTRYIALLKEIISTYGEVTSIEDKMNETNEGTKKYEKLETALDSVNEKLKDFESTYTQVIVTLNDGSKINIPLDDEFSEAINNILKDISKIQDIKMITPDLQKAIDGYEILGKIIDRNIVKSGNQSGTIKPGDIRQTTHEYNELLACTQEISRLENAIANIREKDPNGLFGDLSQLEQAEKILSVLRIRVEEIPRETAFRDLTEGMFENVDWNKFQTEFDKMFELVKTGAISAEDAVNSLCETAHKLSEIPSTVETTKKKKYNIASRENTPRLKANQQIDQQQAESSSSTTDTIVDNEKKQQEAAENTGKVKQEEAKVIEDANEKIAESNKKTEESGKKRKSSTSQSPSVENINNETNQNNENFDISNARILKQINTIKGVITVYKTAEGQIASLLNGKLITMSTGFEDLKNKAEKSLNTIMQLNNELRSHKDKYGDKFDTSAYESSIERERLKLESYVTQAQIYAADSRYALEAQQVLKDYAEVRDNILDKQARKDSVYSAKVAEKNEKEISKLDQLKSRYGKQLSSVNNVFSYLTEYTDVQDAINKLTSVDDVSGVETAFNKLEDIVNKFKQNVKSSASLDPVFATIKKKNDLDNIIEKYILSFEQLGFSSDEAKKKVEALVASSNKLKNIDLKSSTGITDFGKEVRNFNEEEDRIKSLINITKQRQQVYNQNYDKIKQYEQEHMKLNELYMREQEKGSSAKLTADIKEQTAKVSDLKNKAIEASKEINKMFRAGSISKGQRDSAINTVANVYRGNTSSDAALNKVKSEQHTAAIKNVEDLISKLEKAGDYTSDLQQKAMNLWAELNKPQSAENLLNFREQTKALTEEFDALKTAHDAAIQKQKEAQNQYNENIKVIKQLETETDKLNNMMASDMGKGRMTHQIEDQFNNTVKAAENAKKAIQDVDQMFAQGRINAGQHTDAGKAYKEAKQGSTTSQARYEDAKASEAKTQAAKNEKAAIDNLKESLKNLTSAYTQLTSVSTKPGENSFMNALEQVNKARTVFANMYQVAKDTGIDDNQLIDIQQNALVKLNESVSQAGAQAFDSYINKINELENKLRSLNQLTPEAANDLEKLRQSLYSANQNKDLSSFDGIQNYIQNIARYVLIVNEELQRLSRGSQIGTFETQIAEFDQMNVKSVRFISVLEQVKQRLKEFNDFKATTSDKQLISDKEVQLIKQLSPMINELYKEAQGKGTLIPETIGQVKNTEDLERAMKNYAQTLNYTKVVGSALKQENGQLTMSFQNSKGEILKMTGSIDALNHGLRETSVVSRGAAGFVTNLKASFRQMIGYFTRYYTGYMLITRVISYFREGIQIVRDFDAAMTELHKVSNDTTEALKRFEKQSFEIAETIGSTGKEIVNSAADWEKLGYAISEASELARNSALYSNVGDMDIDTATEHMVSTLKAFKEFDAQSSQLIVDKFNEIGLYNKPPYIVIYR